MEIEDKRGRVWEMFIDIVYYDMWCVRWKHDKNFDSHTSFHFDEYDDAIKFLKLLEKSY